eukprot:TRINITY_DN20894_c0_g1_i1.p1 TRINITY_DN20894_c0_g1~~TRINITY_DN20894_c0_g1_i1.p1  ORF type:complete len:889 (-),score=216.80 TRINITY_DN20894_c0_g1_i1:23-2689(-)
MEWAASLEALPGVAKVRPDPTSLAIPEAAVAGDKQRPLLSDLFAATLLPGDAPRLASFLLVSQSATSTAGPGAEASSEVLLQLSVRGLGSEEVVDLQLQVQVPGHDVSASPSSAFRQVLPAAGGRGLLLLAQRCCAAVAVPAELFEKQAVVPALPAPGNSNSSTGGAESSAGRVVRLQAVPMVPCNDKAVTFVKVAWHPLSDAHVGVLLSDGSWQLLNLARRASCSDPEVHFQVNFGGSMEPGESAADFAFCCGPEAALGAAWHGATSAGPRGGGSVIDSEAVWLWFSVLFLSTKGRLSVRNPVVPALAVLPGRALQALAASSASSGVQEDEAVKRQHVDASAWLQQGLLRPEASRELGGPGNRTSSEGVFAVRHRLHLHGGEAEAEAYQQRWLPKEQLISEEREALFEGNSCADREQEMAPPSPRSPRHLRSTYCSVQLVAHSPATVVARATTSGLVELLVLRAGLGPHFEGRQNQTGLSCSIFEEVDLVLGPTKAPPVMRLSLAPEPGPVLLVRTRNLLAAVELPWLNALLQGKAICDAEDGTSLASAQVTTLAEVRASDGPSEFAACQVLPSAAWAEQLEADASAPSAPSTPPRATGKKGAAQGSAAFLLQLPSESSDIRAPMLKAVALRTVLAAAAKARGQKPEARRGSTSSSPGLSGLAAKAAEGEEDSLRRHLAAPLLLESSFGAVLKAGDSSGLGASELAKAVASVRGGQLAGLAARQTLLQHLSKSLPAQAAAAQKDLGELRQRLDEEQGLKARAAQAAARAEAIQQRQKEIAERQDRLARALATELEARGLEAAVAGELPRLWGQLHELRCASELLRAAGASQEKPAGSWAPRSIAQSSSTSLGSLQKAWVSTASEHLGRRALQAEDAVEAAAKAAAAL